MSTPTLEQESNLGEEEFKPAVDVQELVEAKQEFEQAPEALDLEVWSEDERSFVESLRAEITDYEAQIADIEANLPEDPTERWQAEQYANSLRSRIRMKDSIIRTGNASGDYLEASEQNFDELNQARDDYLLLRDGRSKPDEQKLQEAREKYEAAVFQGIKIEYDNILDLLDPSNPDQLEQVLQAGAESASRSAELAKTNIIMTELVAEQRKLSARSAELRHESRGSRFFKAFRKNKIVRVAMAAVIVGGSALTLARGIPDMLPEDVVKSTEWLSSSFMGIGSYLLGRNKTEQFMRHRAETKEQKAAEAEKQQLVSDGAAASLYTSYLDSEAYGVASPKPNAELIDSDPKNNKRVIKHAEHDVQFRLSNAPLTLANAELMKRHVTEVLGDNGILEQIKQGDEMPADLVRLVLHEEVLNQENRIAQNRRVGRVKRIIGGLAGVATFAAASQLSFERLEAPEPDKV